MTERKVMAVVVLGLVIQVAAATGTDIQIRNAIFDSYHVIDNLETVDADIAYALELCAGDTNHLVSVLKGMIVGSTRWDSMLIVQDIGVYGTTNDISFLSAMIANSNTAATAVIAMMRIGGLTSNTTECAQRALSNSLVDRVEKTRACVKMWQLAKMQGASSQISSNAYAVVLSYISGSADNAGCVDRQLVKVDVGYKWSRRRLTALRSVASLDLHELHRAYITNAINEMVAYPESALND